MKAKLRRVALAVLAACPPAYAEQAVPGERIEVTGSRLPSSDVESASPVAVIRAEGRPTIPANLGEEKKLNPFLRAEEITLRKRFGGENKLPHEVFGALRAAKDKF